MRKGWENINFVNCIDKVPKQKQVKSKDYKQSGKYPIVSQEKELISGYWDDDSYLYRHHKPIIIFGDHTKEVKFIDFDFVVGADGTQILCPKDNIDSKFFYYALKATKLRNLGYARHFKLLKEKTFGIPSLPEQQRIVSYLDAQFAKIDQLKENAERQLQAAKDLWQKALNELITPEKGWERKTLKEITNKIGSGATPKGGKKVYLDNGCSLIRSLNVLHGKFKYEDLAHITDEAAELLKGVKIEENDILFNITGASIARCCVVPHNVLPARVNQHVSILRINTETVNPYFICYLLLSEKHQKELLTIGESGATRQALTKTDLENHIIEFPNIEIQSQIIICISELSAKVKALQSNYTETITLCNDLKQALLKKVFEGEL